MRFLVLVAACAAAHAQPLWFEPNQGQAHPSVQFLAHTPGGYVYFAQGKMALRDVRMELIGTNKYAKVALEEPTGGISSYFIGRSEKHWHTGIPHYGRVRYENVYAGIDLVYYASGRDIEYDFVLKPGADPNQIKLAYSKPVQIDANGDLLIAGLKQHRPKVLQNGREIACDYLLHAGNRVQLALADYDHSQPLTVDPVLEYATYFGGPALEYAAAVKTDSSGNVYLGGLARSPAAPGLNPFQQTSGISYQAIVIKFSPSKNAVVFFAVVGGQVGDTYGNNIAVDSAGAVYITGQTTALDLATVNPVQPQFGGLFFDAFASKISPDGRKLVYSTYLGGRSNEEAYGLAVDTNGSAFIVGTTGSPDFPLANAFQSQMNGFATAFLTKLSPDGGKLVFSTFFGGTVHEAGWDVALDNAGNPVIVGFTSSPDFPVKNAYQAKLLAQTSGYVTKFTSDGQSLIYSTLLSGASGTSVAYRVAVDSSGNSYIAGTTSSPDFPVKNPIQSAYGGGQWDVFVSKLAAAGDQLIYSTYLGGSDIDNVDRIIVDENGSAFVTGETISPDFPLKDSLMPYQRHLRGYGFQVFVSQILPSGNVFVYSTLLGGTDNDTRGGGIALDPGGSVWVSGATYATDFPTKNPFQSQNGGLEDMFLAELSPVALPSSSSLSISPSRMSFTTVVGAPPPPNQTSTLSSDKPATVVVTTSTSSGGPWLTATPSSGSSPISFSVAVHSSGLAAGVYSGTVQVALADGTGVPVSLSVNLRVLSGAPQLTGVSPTMVAIGTQAAILTFTGAGFANGAVIELNHNVPLATAFVDANTLKFQADATWFAQAATYGFSVVNPGSAESNTVVLTVGAPQPVFTTAGVVNAASFSTGPVAPGEIVTIFGINLTGDVTFDGTPATLVFASPTQVNVTVPYSVTGPATVVQMGASSIQLPVAPSAPGIFAAVSAGDNIVVLYATGCGALTNDDLPGCALPVSATVNDETAQVLYAGIAPGLVQGANQINIQLPDDITTGQVTIVLTAGDASSKPFNFTLP
jgi:uncharacterized protein (TIGR03437 family)